MNYKVKYSLAGLGVGLGIDIAIFLLGLLGDCFLNWLFCSQIGCITEVITNEGMWLLICIVIVSIIIGFYLGASADKELLEREQQRRRERIAAEEEKRRLQALEEEERRQLQALAEEEQREWEFNQWKNELDSAYKNIEKQMLSTCLPKKSYDEIWKRETKDNGDDNYKKYFQNALNHHRDKLVTDICSCLGGKTKKVTEKVICTDCGYTYDEFPANSKCILCNALVERIEVSTEVKGKATSASNTMIALNKLCFLKASYKNNSRYDLAIKILDGFCTQVVKREPLYAHVNSYGDFELPLDNPDEMEYMDNTALKTLEKLTGDVSCFCDNQNGEFDGITLHMNDFLYNAARLMWYYAKKKPFIVSKFEESRTLYSKYTSENFIPSKYENRSVEERNKHTYRIGKVEEILAVIYSKNQIGGKGTVQQEKEYIDAWLEKKIMDKNTKECGLFVSGLAWMELYELELESLHKMVQGNIQLSAELQDRLRFLESGGTSNVKIYEIGSTTDFVYDSSSMNWNSNEYDVFFRKLAMKKLELNYSLAISNWQKTLPLVSGQKFSFEELYSQFKRMVLDFDGEVSCNKIRARAIDLANVEYPNAILFRFTSERNRCLSMLFSSEKFGRNLNLTIITLFTPETGTDVESMQKYATAIKSNIYVDSFRETILQSVDEVIKVEKKVYEDEDVSSSNEYFE